MSHSLSVPLPTVLSSAGVPQSSEGSTSASDPPTTSATPTSRPPQSTSDPPSTSSSPETSTSPTSSAETSTTPTSSAETSATPTSSARQTSSASVPTSASIPSSVPLSTTASSQSPASFTSVSDASSSQPPSSSRPSSSIPSFTSTSLSASSSSESSTLITSPSPTSSTNTPTSSTARPSTSSSAPTSSSASALPSSTPQIAHALTPALTTVLSTSRSTTLTLTPQLATTTFIVTSIDENGGTRTLTETEVQTGSLVPVAGGRNGGFSHSAGAIAGVTVGSALFAGLLALLLLCTIRRRRTRLLEGRALARAPLFGASEDALPSPSPDPGGSRSPEMMEVGEHVRGGLDGGLGGAAAVGTLQRASGSGSRSGSGARAYGSQSGEGLLAEFDDPGPGAGALVSDSGHGHASSHGHSQSLGHASLEGSSALHHAAGNTGPFGWGPGVQVPLPARSATSLRAARRGSAGAGAGEGMWLAGGEARRQSVGSPYDIPPPVPGSVHDSPPYGRSRDGHSQHNHADGSPRRSDSGASGSGSSGNHSGTKHADKDKEQSKKERRRSGASLGPPSSFNGRAGKAFLQRSLKWAGRGKHGDADGWEGGDDAPTFFESAPRAMGLRVPSPAFGTGAGVGLPSPSTAFASPGPQIHILGADGGARPPSPVETVDVEEPAAPKGLLHPTLGARNASVGALSLRDDVDYSRPIAPRMYSGDSRRSGTETRNGSEVTLEGGEGFEGVPVPGAGIAV